MSKDSSRPPLKIINAKLTNPFFLVKTPTHQNSNQYQPIINTISSSVKQKPLSAQRRIVSIDLKQEEKKVNNVRINNQKRVLKLRRKTESAQKKLASQQKTAISMCSSQRQIRKNASANLLNPRLKCFEEIYCGQLRDQQGEFESSPKERRQNESNWDEVVQRRKQKLYSQIYRMDKKLFSLQRDLDCIGELTGKKAIVEMVKRKTGGERTNHCPNYGQSGVLLPIHIHTNIYKMGKNRIS